MIPRLPIALAAPFLLGALSGCAHDKDKTSIVQAALGTASTPPTVAGATLEPCLATPNLGWGQRASTGVFDRDITLGFARELFMRSGGRVVGDIRVYRVDGSGTTLFGRHRKGWIACIYEERDGALRFLEALSSDGDERIEGDDMDRVTKRIIRDLMAAGRMPVAPDRPDRKAQTDEKRADASLRP